MKKLFSGILSILLIFSMTGCSLDLNNSNSVVNGVDGQNGKDGTSLLTGHGEPSPDLGKVGDSYIDLDTWNYYIKNNQGWELIGNIKGQDGQNGKDGTSLITGHGEPSPDLGKDGDSYIDLDTWNFYIKINGSWEFQGCIKGGGSPSALKCTVNFYSDDELYKTIIVDKGSLVSRPTDPEKEGYFFEGWWTDTDEQWNFNIYPVAQDTNLFAKWTYLYSVVTFNTNGGHLDETTMNISYGDNYTLPTPSREGFVFQGWYYLGERIYDGIWPYKINVTLEASWTEKKQADILNCETYSELKSELSDCSKGVYNILTASSFNSLNYLKDTNNNSKSYYCNFIDSLVIYDDFGNLQKNLATNAIHNSDYTSFTFTIKKDIPWQQYDGTIYTIEGNKQYVSASDFYAGAIYECTYSNQTKENNLITDYVVGAIEYYLYTRILDGQANGNKTFTNLTTNEKKAAWINNTIKASYPALYSLYYESNPLSASDIVNISNKSRFGIVIDETQNTITYNLYKPSVYFPSLLVNQCYWPVNEHFLTEKGSAFGTTSKDSILYNGPYLFKSISDNEISLRANPLYWNSNNIDLLDSINYSIINTSSFDVTTTRTEFELGNIDGFSLNTSDTVGWQKFVLGEDNSGSINEPYDETVNSRLSESYGYTYGSEIIMERSTVGSTKSYSSHGNSTTIANTTRALRLESVRKAILASFDYPTFYSLYNNTDIDSPFNASNHVNTYTAHNLAYDESGNEYVEKYYSNALAEHESITREEAWQMTKPGTYDYCYESQESVNNKVTKALSDIEKYNNSDLAASYGQITLPIQIEYFSLWFDTNSQMNDLASIEKMNKRLNNVSSYTTYDELPYFKLVPTDLCSSSNYNIIQGSMGNAAFDFAPNLWGWSADYNDPLSFLESYTKKGSWSSIMPFLGMDYVPNIRVNGDDVILNDLLEHYTSLVNQGNAENENLENRYSLFAQAEVELIKDLAIFLPQVNNAQSLLLTINRAISLKMDNSSMRDPFANRLVNCYVFSNPTTKQEREWIKHLQDEACAIMGKGDPKALFKN